MALGGIGLTRVTLDELETLYRALHEQRLRYPIRRQDLIAAGFADVADRAEILQGLDERGLRALLVSVIAERKRTA